VRTEGGTAKNMTSCAGQILREGEHLGIAAFANTLGFEPISKCGKGLAHFFADN
jgi:hypothetical protein